MGQLMLYEYFDSEDPELLNFYHEYYGYEYDENDD